MILGIDPGQSCGYAVFDLWSMDIADMQIVNHPDSADFVQYVDYLMHKHSAIDEIVIENFSPRWGQKFDTTPISYLGAADAAAELLDWPPITKVMPSQHKSVIKDSVLTPMMKKQGYKVGAGHSRDALRLCLYRGFKLRHESVYELLGGRK